MQKISLSSELVDFHLELLAQVEVVVGHEHVAEVAEDPVDAVLPQRLRVVFVRQLQHAAHIPFTDIFFYIKEEGRAGLIHISLLPPT